MNLAPDTLISETAEAVFIRPKGRLDAKGASRLRQMLNSKGETPIQKKVQGRRIVFDLDVVTYLDTAGATTLWHLNQIFSANGTPADKISFIHTTPEQLSLIRAADRQAALKDHNPNLKNMSFVIRVGQQTALVLDDVKEYITLTGRITRAGFLSLKHPRKIRWTDTFQVAERAGVNALPIVSLISFIVGLVMAFQAAIPMRMFGAELYVADLIGIAMVRELGPLMTAIVLAGRSASAFAAEIGTMQINEEIDALQVMGLDPVGFLIIPRVIAATFITPLLTIFSNLMGMIGGAFVITGMGYPVISYYNQVAGFVSWNDFVGGLVKCFVFGLIIAATGCIRGYQTTSGPSAVGDATTRAVVTSIVLIAVFDGIFSIVYYFLGI